MCEYAETENIKLSNGKTVREVNEETVSCLAKIK